jgi:hypothetical protein
MNSYRRPLSDHRFSVRSAGLLATCLGTQALRIWLAPTSVLGTQADMNGIYSVSPVVRH